MIQYDLFSNDRVRQTIEETLENETIKNNFYQFLVKNRSEENLDFWYSVLDYKNLSNEHKRKELGKKIWKEYIDRNGATRMINIDDEVAEKITLQVEKEIFGNDLFDDARKYTFYEILEKGVFMRYLRSEDYFHVVHLFKRTDSIKYVPDLYFQNFITDCVDVKDNWTVYKEHKGGIITFTKGKTDICVKLFAKIEVGMDVIIPIITSLDKERKYWDNNFCEGKIIETVSDTIDVIYMVVKPSLLIEKKKRFCIIES